MSTKFSPNKDEFIALSKNMSFTQLAKYYNVAKSTISNYVKREHIDYKNKPKVEDAVHLNEKEVSCLIAQNYTYKEIADHFGITIPNLKYHLRQMNLKVKNTRTNNKFSPDKDEIISLLYDKKLTVSEVAAYYGESKGAVSIWLDRNDIKPKYFGKKKYVLDKKQLKFLKKLAEDGATYNYMANVMNMNPVAIRRILKENEIERAKKPFIFSGEGRSLFKQEHKDMNISQMNSLYNSLAQSYAKEAQKYAVKKDNYSKRVYSELEMSEDKKKLLVNKWKNGVTAKEVAKELHVGESLAHRFMDQNGLTPGLYVRSKKSMPNDAEFISDMFNKYLSNIFLAGKYNVSNTVIGRWRKEICGNDFRFSHNLLIMTEPERTIAEILIKNNIQFRFQTKILKYKIDFDLGLKMCIEVQGAYWHSLDKTKKADKRKEQYLKENGYRIFYAAEEELNDNPNLVEIKLLKFFIGSACQEIDELKNRVNALERCSS